MESSDRVKHRIEYALESRNAAQFSLIRDVVKFAERLTEEAEKARVESPRKAVQRLQHAVAWGVVNLDFDTANETILRWTERLVLAFGEFAEVDTGIKDE